MNSLGINNCECKCNQCNKVLLTPSLLMRLFEWCHEDAKDDVAMHYAFENIIAFTDGTNVLDMEDYESIIKNAGKKEECEDGECEDVCQEPVCYDDVDTYCKSFDTGCCIDSYGEEPTVIKLDCVKDVCDNEPCEECIPPEIQKQMYEIINLAK